MALGSILTGASKAGKVDVPGPSAGLRAATDDLAELSTKVGKELTDVEYIQQQAKRLSAKSTLYRDGGLRAPDQTGGIGIVKLKELKAAGDVRGLVDAFRNVSDYQFAKDGGGLGGTPLLQDAMTKPAWQHSGRKVKMVMMSPTDYLARSAKGHGMEYEELLAQVAQGDRTDRIVSGMMEGEQFAMPYFDYRGGSFGQEGQHRAHAAAMLGIDKIPVAVLWDDVKAVAKTPVRDDVAELEAAARAGRKAEGGFTDDVVYHSTAATREFEEKEGFKGFSHFGTKKAAEDRFNDQIKNADAEHPRDKARKAGAPRTVPVNLKVHNPLEIRDNGLSDAHSHMQAAIQGMIDIVPEAKLEEYIRHFKAIGKNQEQQFAQIRRMLEAEGFDGLKYTNLAEDAGSESIVSLRPEQVRSPNAEFKDLKKGNIMAGGVAGAVGLSQADESQASTMPSDTVETFRRSAPLSDLIGKKESQGKYDIAFGGEKVDFPNMTLKEVLEWQEGKIKGGAESVAAGKYQIINSTLKMLMKENPTDLPPDRLMDKETQDAMATYLLKKRGVDKYLDGKMSKDELLLNLAKEWASFPVPKAMTNGKGVKLKRGDSYHKGVGTNKALISVDDVEKIIDQMRPTP